MSSRVLYPVSLIDAKGLTYTGTLSSIWKIVPRAAFSVPDYAYGAVSGK